MTVAVGTRNRCLIQPGEEKLETGTDMGVGAAFPWCVSYSAGTGPKNWSHQDAGSVLKPGVLWQVGLMLGREWQWGDASCSSWCGDAVLQSLQGASCPWVLLCSQGPSGIQDSGILGLMILGVVVGGGEVGHVSGVKPLSK